MMYSEKDGRVILTMSREDYLLISDSLRTLPTFRPDLWDRLRALLGRLNSGQRS
jgi:hypothetical protein